LDFAEYALENLLMRESSLEFANQVGNQNIMDNLSDMLARIRNSYMREHKSLSMPHSKLRMEVLKVMEKNRYVKRVKEGKEDGKKTIEVELKYEDGSPAITGSRRVSKPGQRIYSNSKNIQRAGGRRGMIILSTSQGIMPHWEAKKRKTGGEVLCNIY